MKLKLLLIALISIQTSVLSANVRQITETEARQRIAKRFEHFANLRNKDSAECCLISFAATLKAIRNPSYGHYARALNEMRQTKDILKIIETFRPHLRELPRSMRHKIETMSSADLVTLLGRRIKNNGNIDCQKIEHSLQ